MSNKNIYKKKYKFQINIITVEAKNKLESLLVG